MELNRLHALNFIFRILIYFIYFKYQQFTLLKYLSFILENNNYINIMLHNIILFLNYSKLIINLEKIALKYINLYSLKIKIK